MRSIRQSVILLSLVVAGCTTAATEQSGTTTASLPVAAAAASADMAAPDRTAFVGTWTGTAANGDTRVVTIPASGSIGYNYNGQNNQPDASFSGNSLLLSFDDGGRATLTPLGSDQMRLSFSRPGGRPVTAVLSRA